MTEEQARRLWDYTTTALGDNGSWVHQIGNGEYVVILRKHGYHLWSFEEWTAYHKIAKKGNVKRSDRPAIDTSVPYTLQLPFV